MSQTSPVSTPYLQMDKLRSELRAFEGLLNRMASTADERDHIRCASRLGEQVHQVYLSLDRLCEELDDADAGYPGCFKYI